MMKFVDGRFFVPLLVIALGIVRGGLRAYGIGPKDIMIDVKLIGFFLLLCGVLWVVDRVGKGRGKNSGLKNKPRSKETGDHQ